MCGLAGYSGVKNASTRLALTMALGLGIDARGGHAAGYVSLPETATGKAIRLAKRIGKWGDASARFVYGASLGRVCMMHSRFATCGSKDNVEHAHPFVVRREGKSVLYGAHNGVLSGTWMSARKNGREHTVDSREMLELLADKQYDAIKELEGYGVVTWVTPDAGVVNVVRLSSSSEFIAVHLKEGGIAWASTWSILGAALKVSNLTADESIVTSEVGQVYQLTPKGAVVHSDHPAVMVKPDEPWYKKASYSGYGSYYDHDLTGDEWDWKREERRYNQTKSQTLGYQYRGKTPTPVPVTKRPTMPPEPTSTKFQRDEEGNWIGTVFGAKPHGVPAGKIPADAYSVLPSGKCYLRHYFSESAYKWERAKEHDQAEGEAWLDAANRCADINKAAIAANDAKWDALQKAKAFMAENERLRREASAKRAMVLPASLMTRQHPTAKSLLDEWDDMYLQDQARKDAAKAYSADELASGLIGTKDDHNSYDGEAYVRVDITTCPDSGEEEETETDINSLGMTLSDYLADEGE